MAFIPALNTVRTTMVYLQDNQRVTNVFHTKFPSAPDTQDLADLNLAWQAWWADQRADVSSQLILQRTESVDLTVANGAGKILDCTVNCAGTGASPALPNSVTVVVKWTTGQTGRSFRGRTYHLGLQEDQVLNNNVVNAVVSALEANYALVPHLGDIGLNPQLVVASFYSGVDTNGNPIPRTSAVLTPITGLSIDPVIDNQRRRLPGRGN